MDPFLAASFLAACERGETVTSKRIWREMSVTERKQTTSMLAVAAVVIWQQMNDSDRQLTVEAFDELTGRAAT